MSRATRVIRWAAGTFVALLAVIQFIPVERTNPPVETEVPASADAREVLRRACYDCHSNETVWPWYSRVAPASWLAVRDVNEGREHVNFSTWNRLSEKERAEALEEAWEEIEEGKMPLWIYRPMHPEAKLTAADRAVLKAWSDAGRAGPQVGLSDR